MSIQSSSPSDLVRVEARALLALAMRLDATMLDPFSRAVEHIKTCADTRRRVILIGMGKSGLIARKIAATLCSTGTPAHFLHPADALHGDLGIVAEGDVAIALSASGETEEVIRLIPALKRLHVCLVGLVGSPASTLARTCDILLDSSVTEEACTLNLAPTASTTVMLALGDALAIEVSRRRNFQAEDFAFLHPGGRLGRLLTPVRDLMHAGEALPYVTSSTPMTEVIYEMSRKKLGMTTVVAEASPGELRLLGLVSDGDLRRLLEREGPHALEHAAGEIMNTNPVTVRPGALAPEALTLMEQKKITSLVVTHPAADGERVEGVVHLHDLWTLELS